MFFLGAKVRCLEISTKILATFRKYSYICGRKRITLRLGLSKDASTE